MNLMTRSFPSWFFGSALLLCTLFLTACGDDEPIVLPEGVQVLTGSVLPTDISLLRRGTHLFQVDDEDVYFLESTAVNLRKYERKHVVLQGEVSPNVDSSYLPLLTVEAVLDVLEQETKEWKLRSFGVTFELPDSWGGSIESALSSFVPLGSSDPAIIFQWEESEEQEKEENTEEQLDYDSTPIVIDGTRATKSVDSQTGNETVRIERPNGVIQITYIALDHPHAQQWHADWISALASMELADTRVPDTPTSTGAITGSPCGGPAGILCPEGFYCDVTNLQENIGVCRSLQ